MKKFLTLILMLLIVFNVVSFADESPAEPIDAPAEVEVDVTTDPAPSEGFLGLSITTWLIILVGALLLILLVSAASRGRGR